MIRYVIEKQINNDYAHGVMILTEKNGSPKTFASKDKAFEWLVNNDEDIRDIPLIHIPYYYNIRPHII